jgi:ABC-type Zn uptake system ZnuABC Zn-binding protein ZnuA
VKDILQAAAQAGAKYYFVEQDFSTDPMRSLRQNYSFLERIGF